MLERLVNALRQSIAISERAVSLEEASILPSHDVCVRQVAPAQTPSTTPTLTPTLTPTPTPTPTPTMASGATAAPVHLCNPDAGMAYVELSVRRLINSLKMLPDFRSLPLEQQMQLLKVFFTRTSFSHMNT